MVRERKDIYLIFPYDKDRKVAGVYVGSSKWLRVRINSHKDTYRHRPEDDPQRELHEMMRENGFELLKVDTVNEFTKWREYVWIDMFCKYTNLRVFNKFRGGYGRCAAACVYRKYWGIPFIKSYVEQ